MSTWIAITLRTAGAVTDTNATIQKIRAPIQRAIRRVVPSDKAAISTEKAGWILLSIVIVGAVYAGLNEQINNVLSRVAEEMGKIIGSGTTTTGATTSSTS